jgi:hypothetical protein
MCVYVANKIILLYEKLCTSFSMHGMHGELHDIESIHRSVVVIVDSKASIHLMVISKYSVPDSADSYSLLVVPSSITGHIDEPLALYDISFTIVDRFARRPTVDRQAGIRRTRSLTANQRFRNASL